MFFQKKKKDQLVRVMTPLIPCSRLASGRFHPGHYATSVVVHPAQNMVFQHQTEPEIVPVQRKLRFFNFYFIFPLITSSPERPRLRFNHTGERCFYKVCCFPKENLTFHNSLEYQKNESACGAPKRYDFYGFGFIRPKPIFRSPEKHFMTFFFHLRLSSNGKSGLATPKVMPS